MVCGDGQCDSLGHTATNLSYFLMELVSGYILEVDVCSTFFFLLEVFFFSYYYLSFIFKLFKAVYKVPLGASSNSKQVGFPCKLRTKPNLFLLLILQMIILLQFSTV